MSRLVTTFDFLGAVVCLCVCCLAMPIAAAVAAAVAVAVVLSCRDLLFGTSHE